MYQVVQYPNLVYDKECIGPDMHLPSLVGYENCVVRRSIQCREGAALRPVVSVVE